MTRAILAVALILSTAFLTFGCGEQQSTTPSDVQEMATPEGSEMKDMEGMEEGSEMKPMEEGVDMESMEGSKTK